MLAHHNATWLRHGDTANPGASYPALTSLPTLVTDGVAVPPDKRDWLGTLDIKHTAAGARSFTVVLLGYKPAISILIAGVLTAIIGAEGWTNIGTIDVTGSANASESHQLCGVSGFTRLAAQVTSPVGAPTVWTDFGFSYHQKKEE